MATISVKVILILVGNLNSSCSYLITTVIGLFNIDAYAKLIKNALKDDYV